MNDAVRPGKEKSDQLLDDSSSQWSSYLEDANATPLLLSNCLDLKRVLGRTPSFLGYGSLPEEAKVSFTCVEKESRKGEYGLMASVQSVWSVSCGYCCLEPKLMPLDILLAVPDPLIVQISDSAPLTSWPGVQGLSGYDEGNYITVLFLAWSYILSARWAEALKHSSEHRCTSKFKVKTCQSSVKPDQQHRVEIDLGSDIEADEANWWNALLSPGGGWEITTDYRQKTYLSPWSALLSDAVYIGLARHSSLDESGPPSSNTALKYLARFCSHYRLYGQCSAALAAALYIPFLNGRPVTLPLPTPVLQVQSSTASQCSLASDLIAEHGKLLTYYMTLSCNVWGMRSLLFSTFFNAKVDCNLVSAWINPAFAIINPLVQEENFTLLTNVLARRKPILGSLWLGAVLTGIARSMLRDIRTGLTALELNAAAWTGIEQSFITEKPSISDGIVIRREDECRLLFMIGCDGHARPPIYPWKPFGETRLRDAELPVQLQALCNCHFLDYQYWNWSLRNGEMLEDSGMATTASDEADLKTNESKAALPTHYTCDLSSESASEVATRGIFGWLRSTGYAANEKPLYQHSWIDIESSDDEEGDDVESDIVKGTDPPTSIEDWLSGID